MSDPSDDELVARARASGDDALAAYETLVRKHQGRVLRLATYLLGTDGDAEDVTQDTFLRAHAHLARFRAGSSFPAWLRTIATRLSFNLRRDRQARASRGDAADLESAAEPSSTRTAVEWTLAQMSYPYREVLILRFVEELSLEEISETLDIGLSAAKMRLARARESFTDVYKREHKTPLPMPLLEAP